MNFHKMTNNVYKSVTLHGNIRDMLERLKQPSSRWKIWGVVLALISIYYNLNYRIESLEEFREQVDVIEIRTTLAQIQSDISWIKNDLASKK